jgi:mannose-6-phosphate isomerase-like protein (cupin superfamily)
MRRVKITKKPWGEEHLFACTDTYAGKTLFINKGHRLSLQFHCVKVETLFLVSGKIRLIKGVGKRLKTLIVDPGMAFHLPCKTIHRIEALKKSCLFEVSTPQLHDVVRLEDDYKREKKHG